MGVHFSLLNHIMIGLAKILSSLLMVRVSSFMPVGVIGYHSQQGVVCTTLKQDMHRVYQSFLTRNNFEVHKQIIMDRIIICIKD